MSAKGKDSKEKKAAMAAVRKAYRKKQGRSNALASIIAVPVFIVLIGACVVSIIGDKVELSEKQQELEVLKAQAEALEAENASYESILNEDDERTYMERIAMEKLGVCLSRRTQILRHYSKLIRRFSAFS